jgi:phage head maturation protease
MSEKQFREFIVAKESTDDGDTAVAAISTSTVDRDKEVMNPQGIDYENYNKNPVVLFAHQYDEPPIGKSLWVKGGRKYVKAKWKWARTQKALEIKQLWDGGFLNAVSVGFLPTESHEPLPVEIQANPELANARRIIDKWELLEFSIVPVPSNPDALAAAVSTLNISTSTQKELGLCASDIGTSSNNESVGVAIRGPKGIKPPKMRRLSHLVETVNAKLKGRIYLDD